MRAPIPIVLSALFLSASATAGRPFGVTDPIHPAATRGINLPPSPPSGGRVLKVRGVRGALQQTRRARGASPVPARPGLLEEVARLVREPMGMAFTPDGEHVVLTFWAWDFKVIELATGRERLSKDIWEEPVYGQGVALSSAVAASDTELFFGYADQMVRVRSLVDGGKVRDFEPRPLGQTFSDLRYSAAGKWVVGRGPTHVRVWQARTGKELRRYEARIRDLDLHPDGRHLVMIDQDGVVRVADPIAGAIRVAFPEPVPGLRRVKVSPDGEALLTWDGGRPPFLLVDPAHGLVRQAYAGHTGNAVDAAFFPNRPWVASVGAERTVQVWHPAGGATLYARTFPTDVRRIGVSPTGKYVVVVLKDETIVYRVNAPTPSPGRGKPARRGSR